MRQGHHTLFGKDVCGYATGMLAAALSSVGLVTGSATVSSLSLLQLLIRAACERRSLEAIASASQLLPSVQTIRNALQKLLPKTTEEMEPVISKSLHGRLPKGLSKRPRTMAIDMHNCPYYGDKETPGTYRGQKKASTKTFFAYATLLVLRKGQTYTVGAVSIVNGEELTCIIDKLLAQAAKAGLRPSQLLLDRGFYAAKVMLHLKGKKIPFVIPMIRRGKSGATRENCTGTTQYFLRGRRGWTTYRWEARLRTNGRKGSRVQMTTDVCMAPRTRKRGQKKNCAPLVFACYGMKHCSPVEIRELYRKRFHIETSYRQMREGLARTCSRNPVYRLLLVLIAFVLRNVWVWLHWTKLFGRDGQGRRILRLKLMRAKTMLHWILQYLDGILGIPNSINIPNPIAAVA
jgi:hypothetical protein